MTANRDGMAVDPTGRTVRCPDGTECMHPWHGPAPLEQPDAPTDLELSLQVKDAALGAVRILGREKRALAAEVAALRAKLTDAEER